MSEKEEEKKEEVEKEETADPEVEEEDPEEGEDPEAEEEEESKKIVERDFDKELEEEEKQGKPDAKKAHERIKAKEGEEEEAEDDDNQPVTRGELKKIRQDAEKVALESAAISFAATLTDNEKEARLVVAKWKNRSYPTGMPLDKQIREAYVVTNADKILGETAETRRALKNRNRSNNNGAGSHRDAPINPSEPKLSEAERANLKAAGFEYNAKNRRFEKQLKRGVLVRDPKTKRTSVVPKK